MERSQHSNQITGGVIWKQLLLFFLPIVVGTLFQQLYNTVDAVIVGRFVGKAALASVGGSAAMITNLVLGFFTGLSAGATVVISQFYGAEDHRNLHRSLHTAYAISLVASVVLAVLGWFMTPWLLRLMQTPAEALEDAIVYLRVYFLGIVAILVYNMGSSIMRAVGDSRRPLYYLILCCALNIILDLLLVLVFPLGIMGAAIATVISQGVSALLVTRALMKCYDGLKLELNQIRIDPAKLKAEFQIGLPSGVQSCMYGVSNMVIQTAINGFGTDTAAAWAAYGKMDAVFWAVCGALGVSITTFVGQNYGAHRYDRVFKSVRVCMLMSAVICGSIMAVLLYFCEPLFRIFNEDANVIAIGTYMVRYMMPSYLVYVVIEILSGALRGVSDVLIPTLITLGGVVFLRVPWILFVLPVYPALETVMLSYPLSWTLTALLFIPCYFYRKRVILQNEKNITQ